MMPTGTGAYIRYISIAMIIIVIDQITKDIAYTTLLGQPAQPVLPILDLVLIFNEGAAFGFLHNAGGWQHIVLGGLAVIVSCVLLVWIWRIKSDHFELPLGLSLILGGAIGNLIDRAVHQFVIDFIYFHYQDWYFPAFNVADMAISAGAILFILDSFGWRLTGKKDQ